MKRFITSIGLIAAMLLPAVGNAFTTQELSEVAWIATYTSNPNFNSSRLSKAPLIDSHGVTAELISDTQIRLNGFMGCLDFVFTLSDANGNATTNGEYLCITANDYAVNVSNPDYKSQSWQMLQSVRDGYNYWVGVTYARTSDNFLLKISKNDDGYTMLSTSPLFIHGSADSGFNDYMIRIFDQLEMNSFIPNAIASDRFYEEYSFRAPYRPTSSELIREYPVRVEMDYTNNRFTILNFGNNGYGLREDTQYYPNLNGTGINYFSDGKFIIGGTFDPDTKKLIFDTNQFAKPVWAPYSAYYEYMFNFQLERLELEGEVK